MDDNEDPLVTAKNRVDAALEQIDDVLRLTRELTQSADANVANEAAPPQTSPGADDDPPKS